MIRVLDASALIAYLAKESGYEKVKDALAHAAESEKRLLISAVNWGEVYYFLIKKFGIDQTNYILSLVETFPLDVIAANQETAKQAGWYKAQKRLSYDDGYAAALAKSHKGELLTSDKDFKEVEGEFKILWV